MKMQSPAAERNRKPIAEILKKYLPQQGLVLEISSGSGMHSFHFAKSFPTLTWQPSDPALDARESIHIYRNELGQDNLLPPLNLDVLEHPWPLERANFIVNLNMLHISPPATCEGLMKGASQLLDKNEYLYLYGPFILTGRETAASNIAFDQWLKAKDPTYGIRELRKVISIAQKYSLNFETQIDMPANNISVLFQKR